MHKRKVRAIIVILILISIGYSCKKKKQEPTETYTQTPYALQYPGFVDSAIGAPLASADNPLTVEGIALGRKLFFDTRLSKDMTISCASCHGQQHSFDDSNQFSRGVNAALGERNAMPLINLAWSNRFFWDGRKNSLEGQAHDPVINPVEMATTWPVVTERLQKDTAYVTMFFKAFGIKKIDSTFVTKAIAQFERTLISFSSSFDREIYRRESVLDFRQQLGFEAFQKFKCNTCHTIGLFTDHSFRNNGLDLMPLDSGLAKFTHSMNDFGKFKVPTLRNVALTAPYMHDGRFETLRQVVVFYSRGLQLSSPNVDSNIKNFVEINIAMTQLEMDNLVAFLEALTDTSFTINPAYSKQ